MTINNTSAKPFLKWAGGKTQLLSEIEKRIPFKKDDRFTYIEPFVGSGAVFIWMMRSFPKIEKAVINDVNSDLTQAYDSVKNHLKELTSILFDFEKEYNSLIHEPEKRSQIYYQKRDLFNTRKSSAVEQSALFIFLNKTCYNGLYRVNKSNEYNVPQGNYKKPKICNAKNLLALSELLRKVIILNGDYKETLNTADERSLFYFDPPYKPISRSSNFNSYSQNVFGDKEQIELKEFCDIVGEQGKLWLLSNSDLRNAEPKDEFFDTLYQDYKIERVLAKRRINSNSKKRGLLTELLISNY
ncbi:MULTISPECIES: DNA adenine methylase [unclassified Lentimicrobium]|uniref:DNA adenine methylase n=1 Tax=unclassified Lentimicrobium TaxID=2677434 RepID=UPI001551B3CC|nr:MULTISPECIES: DNA adenine methylase [unclassified Lentimicrobium]NPD44795.1 DNA adenine methylase [Lentimicrobium sp. S6]NPD83188.1 DNA adenine methylase [Lentimicrobium sp. L6]